MTRYAARAYIPAGRESGRGERRISVNIIREVAWIMAEKMRFWRSGGEDYTFEDAQRANREGWTIEKGGALGSTVRVSDVYLTEEELKQAYELAQKLA